ncbi:MAG: hypothetical protein Q9219_007290, partial [cf. Caloplaca sp. 3 TL-2023]
MKDTADEDGTMDFSMEELSTTSNDDSPPISPTWPTVSDVHRALRPLQITADKIGKQAEEFAETLDRLSKPNRDKPNDDCSNALKLVDGYRHTARKTVEYLKGLRGLDRLKRLGGESNEDPRGKVSKSASRHAQSQNFADSTTVKDLDSWEQEEQTWHLLGLILQVEYPFAKSSTKGAYHKECLARPSKKPVIHQYSSEREVWLHFLAHDDQAWERYSVVEWLKTCADDSGPEIEQVIQDLEERADRGSGLWAHSWLYTKEAIKGQKRLRSWPQALAPNSPGIDSSLRTADRAKSLVTQLDPDALIRQGRSLEAQDESFERAIWLACWEMVRRGKDWNFIRAKCQERVEHWRAIVVRGDPQQHNLHAAQTILGSEAAGNWQSRALWRKSCALAASSGLLDRYEAAVQPLVDANDYQLLRIVTHVAFIYQDLGRLRNDNKYRKTAEAFIDAYIDFLGQAGKQQLLPLYASRMSPGSAITSLSRQLPLIVERGERRTVMKLMKYYGIDIPRVLNAQLLMIMDNIEAEEKRSMNEPSYPSLKILAPQGEKQQGEMSGMRDGFMGDTMTNDQHDLINAFEWYLLLDGHWEKTLATGAVLYKCFLKHSSGKGLAAAKKLSQKVTFSNLSREKTKAILGREVDISNLNYEEEDGSLHQATSRAGDYNQSRHQPIHRSRREEERYLLWQSSSFFNLEQLLNVLTAFEQWQAAIAKKPRNADLGGRISKQWRDEVRGAYERVEACMQPLLRDWLQYSRD